MHASPFDPFEHIAGIPGVRIRHVRLPDDELGGYADDETTILLDYRLSRVEERTTAAHEGVHAERRDVCCKGVGPDGDRLHARQERYADVLSAQRLVELDALAEALATTHNLAEAAEQVDVDEDTLWARLEALNDQEKDYVQKRIDGIEGKTWPLT